MNNFIPVNEPLIDGNEKKYLKECIETGWISSEGPFVKKFEEKFAKRMGRKHGIAVSNGTAAIDISVEALDIGPGDEVILPSFTIISCILQVVRCGATPILVDSDFSTWNMNIENIERKITPKTKAIIAVHIYGLPVDMNPLLEICKKYKIKLIEDSAEMIGQNYNNKPCGSFGDISTFSFYSNKHITTGEGGMILTDNDMIARKCRDLRNLCFVEGKRFVHKKFGWNYRITNLQAAVGVAQLEQLDRFIKKKRLIGRTYNQLLKNISGISLPREFTSYAENIYWVYGIILNESLKVSAEVVIKKMNKLGIGCRPFFYPMHKQPVLKKLGLFKNQTYPVADKLQRKGFYIPSGLALTQKQIILVVNALKKVLKNY